MTEQCPLTCNRCPGTSYRPVIPWQACFDRYGADGTSNCAAVAYLCENPLYHRLMQEQCPRTCKYC
ncbi:hypothetical protein LOAG_15650 [Loa loa]|uniref:ShKT domain-containing protein n=1 Tax=Loa loa TaxID=7209 RepID=A0A1S0TFB7_LOALO|nr:hypothetical protein LOAG_15650 [Loa loa]EFO12883.1 hypothetical protein LOAG_15650 [Loa loa]